MTDYRNYRLNRKETALLALASAILCLGMGELFYGTLYIGLLAPAAFFGLRPAVEKILAGRRRERLRAAFKDALYSFSATFSTGGHMNEAIREAAAYVASIYGDGAEMVSELKRMDALVRSVGADEAALWYDLAERSGIEYLREFAAVYSACRETGGNLIYAVDKAAEVLTDKIEVESEIRSMSAQKKLEGRVIGVLPPVLILFLRASSPGYMAVMYETWIGRIFMTAAIGATVFAAVMTEKITRIEI